jgi:hypothetical protein
LSPEQPEPMKEMLAAMLGACPGRTEQTDF